MIMRADEKHLSWEGLKEALMELDEAICADDYPRTRELFYELVDGYTAENDIVDLVYQERGKRRDGKNSTTAAHRSEEHPSELQSLMRISYAVFCLKKKN